ncbi:MAG: acetyl-CoA carboxylase carboxyltransferase subunit alpha [Candidatus Eisenbacteria bacterium]
MAIKSARSKSPAAAPAPPVSDPLPPPRAPADEASAPPATADAPEAKAPAAKARGKKASGLPGGPYLDFEKPIIELELKIADLRAHAAGENMPLEKELASLEARAERLRRKVYDNLTRYQRVQLARHPRRPYLLDYVERLTTDFFELHGDRGFADDRAIVGGLARFEGEPLMILGTQKGRDTKENLLRRFGMANPEGYRKALRLMQLANNFGAPILTLVDTAGAFPGLGAEERGQAEAIARNLREMCRLTVPFISVITGEGGSGGALALAMGDVVLMFENSIYSVISPEGCASILWRDRARSQQAADALRLTAADCLELGIVDEILAEPVGGAHRDPVATAATLGAALARHYAALREIPPGELVKRRRAKYRAMGVFTSGGAA